MMCDIPDGFWITPKIKGVSMDEETQKPNTPTIKFPVFDDPDIRHRIMFIKDQAADIAQQIDGVADAITVLGNASADPNSTAELSLSFARILREIGASASNVAELLAEAEGGEKQ